MWQMTWFTITDEKLFRMSSYSHKWHDYHEQFIWKIFIFSCVMQKDILNVVNWVENLQETKRFLDHQTIWSWRICGCSTNFFFIVLDFFLFWLWCNEMFVRTFLQGQICSYIASSHLYHLLIRVKVQNCHGGKKTAFFPPVTRSRALFDKISLG